ncbi:Zinc finger C3HC4 type, RING finger protein [Rhodotorula toruloides ATCC 204091]|uniref:BY PROTMAP: gi/342319652/gb/EGU11599.1/ Zinc finger C3HC4 type, RING finger protein [Rhodotorula glutinis ATCC 204091] n=1 Tax=Rhodotorula toruloides TaxID=5286 RepID=A0A0K3CJU1_RHOTO|nr:Zinc finger C3HC4 type, RING finger protein [Rhodotorula toruloides ATCC 204091]
MASPSSPYLHHPAQYGGAAYGHPAVGGKGIPMHIPAPAYDPSSPAPSSPSIASSSARWAHQPGLAGGPPDLTGIRKDLTLELAEKEEKVQQLQDEVDLILDQIHDSDYAHLRPKHDSLFSDDEDEGFELDDDEDELLHVKAEDGEEAGEGDIKGKKRMRLRDLEDEEDERRKELEAKYGIDGTKQVVSRA